MSLGRRQTKSFFFFYRKFKQFETCQAFSEERHEINLAPCLFPRFTSFSCDSNTLNNGWRREKFSFSPTPLILFAYVTQGHRGLKIALLSSCDVKLKAHWSGDTCCWGISILVLLHLTILPSSLQHRIHLSVQGYFSLRQAFWNIMMYMWL